MKLAMKLNNLTLPALALMLLTATGFADEPSCCSKCEMMKKPAAAAAAAETGNAELDKLVAEMNGNLGPRKIEAMAAIVTRLVEQAKAQAAQPGAKAPAGGEAAKGEAHQH